MRHLEVHNNEQSHSITVLDVPLCLLNHLSQLLFALCLLLISCICVRVHVYVCARDNVGDSVGIPSMRFARLSCLLAVMNLIPNEIQQRSLWRRDALPHPANSLLSLKEEGNSSTEILWSLLRLNSKFHRGNILDFWIRIKQVLT